MNNKALAALIITSSLIEIQGCNTPTTSDTPKTDKKQKPNVLIIMTDDQGWGDLGYHGNDTIETPALDKLFAESVRFHRFYVSPVSAPTRASLLTGRYHLRTGTNGVTRRREVVRANETNIAEILKENGYTTACFGKWHNGAQYPNNPNGQGFDEFLGFCAGHWNNYFDTKLQHNEKQVATKGYLPDVLTDSTIQFVKNAKQPFFCYLAYNTPHSPFQVPDKYFDKYKQKGLDDKNACVYGMCGNIDDNIHRILQTLKQSDIEKHTIVIFLTDNGPNGHRYNGGMKGIKGSVHEGGVRVPMCIRYPEKLTKPQTINQFAAHIDILPTILKLCEIPRPENIVFDGKDLTPLLLNSDTTWCDRKFFSHHVCNTMDTIPAAVRTQQYLLTLYPHDTALYDLQTDLLQKKDISEEKPDITQSLLHDFITWYARVTENGLQKQAIPVGYTEFPVTMLDAPEAEITGELQYKGKYGWANDWIINWINTNDSISWQLNIANAGSYTFSLLYACTPSQTGSVIQLHTNNGLLERHVNEAHKADTIFSPDRVARKEVYERNWGELQMGTVQLQPGAQNISLKAKKIAKDEVAEIKALKIQYF